MDPGGGREHNDQMASAAGLRWPASRRRLAFRPPEALVSERAQSVPTAAATATLAAQAPGLSRGEEVKRDNFAAVHGVVEDHRRQCEPLFHGGSMEDALQLGTPDGSRRPEGRDAS